MTKLLAHFDGRVLIPEKPIDLPKDCLLQVLVEPVKPKVRPLSKLAELAGTFPDDSELPNDAASQHDHYLYGLPKKP